MVDAAKVLTDSCQALIAGIQAGVRDPAARNDLARAAKMVLLADTKKKLLYQGSSFSITVGK